MWAMPVANDHPWVILFGPLLNYLITIILTINIIIIIIITLSTIHHLIMTKGIPCLALSVTRGHRVRGRICKLSYIQVIFLILMMMLKLMWKRWIVMAKFSPEIKYFKQSVGSP